MMRVVITGGSGFIGTNLVSFYIERGVEVCNIDSAPPRNKEHRQFWKQVDIMDFERLREEIHKFSPTHIFHLAARTGLNNKDINVYAANFRGVENVILAYKGLPNLQRVIFTSSMLVCKPDYLPKGDEDYEYLKWLEGKEEEELPTLAKKLLHRSIKGNKERRASEMFGEGKISFFESCEMVKAAPSEMIGILIKNGVKIGSELIPPDIGLKNLREYWK